MFDSKAATLTRPTTPADIAEIRTLPALFAWRVKRSPLGLAYREFDAIAEQWRDYSWHDTDEAVAHWKAALQQLALSKGDRVAILLPNGMAAVTADQAALAAGLVPVPMHALDNPGSIVYILNDSEAVVLFVNTLQEWQGILQVRESMPALQRVIVVDPQAAIPAASSELPKLLRLKDWLAGQEGAAMPANAADAVVTTVTEDDLAAIVYTSGTTGKPKGVMLTQRNVVANLKSVLARVPVRADDVFLSFLPLSHTFERTAGYYLAIAAGSCVAYVRAVAQIAADLKTIRPTVLISVPRIYERMHAQIRETLIEATPLRQKLFAAAEAMGWRQFCRRQGMGVDGGSALLDALLWPLLDRLVAQQIRDIFGGRLRTAVSGGAPLTEEVARSFIGLGVPLLQGYGMTESSPVVAANSLNENRPRTVGKVLTGVQVRIGDNRELQVQGDNVMRGYWKRPADTQTAMTPDGWLRTGDQAEIDDGFITIRGRIKEIIVTSTGEKVPPADLELAIGADALFDQVAVVGEGRPFITAFVVLNPDGWKRLAAELNVSVAESSLNTAVTARAIQRRVEEATKSFPRYAVPRAVWSTLEPWSLKNGLMTPTLKLKRNNLQSHFQEQIDAIYHGHGAPAAKP